MNNEDQEVKHCGILVVDDDEDYISFVKDALPGFGFKNLFFANNGYDCINILAEKKELIYLVLLDIRMPNMSGIQVIEHLMNVHKFIVGIIVVTGYRSPAEKNYCFALNSPNIIIANWFEKPGKFFEWITEIERVINVIIEKRLLQSDLTKQYIVRNLNYIKENLITQKDLEPIKKEIENISCSTHGFIYNLGMDVIRIIIIALAVVCLLYFGIDKLIRSIINY